MIDNVHIWINDTNCQPLSKGSIKRLSDQRRRAKAARADQYRRIVIEEELAARSRLRAATLTRYPERLRDLARVCARIVAMRPKPPYSYNHALALVARFRAKQPIPYAEIVAFEHAFVWDGGKLVEPPCCAKCARDGR
jgi:hypothetical protein